MSYVFKVSEKAQRQLVRLLKKTETLSLGQQRRFRISVSGGGCSGFQYLFSIDDTVTSEDSFFGQEDAQVVIDEISLNFLNGSELDYEDELIGSQFVIKGNPNAASSCGCGSSFSVI